MLLGTRHGAAAGGLALVFGFGIVRQASRLYEGPPPALEPSAKVAGELAILGIALGGLAALRALRRTTRERDRAEDLHWDSMEAVRVMSELAARPGAELSDKLRTVLELGATRFELELGIAWRDDGTHEGELLGLRTPTAHAPYGEDWVEELLPRLREVSQATRPQVLVDRDAEPRVFFGTGVGVDGNVHGALAFAGWRAPEERFTATDKDVLGLMGQWLATELERRERGTAPPREPAPRYGLAPLLPRRSRDLNAAVQRAEHALRRQVGVDATLELSLDPKLPPARSGRLSLSTLVESVVLAAARLAPAGRIHLETRQQGGAQQPGDLMLCVSVKGDTIDAGALERIFSQDDAEEVPRGALPLARLERLLRRDGGDLSVAVEPLRAASLTAYLPATAPRASEARPSQSIQPSR